MNDQPQEAKLESMLVHIPLAVFGRHHIDFNAPDSTQMRIAIRALDPVQFYCVRFSHQPDVIAGIPVIAGADVKPVQAAAVMKLESEFKRLGLSWPGEITVVDV